MQLSHRNQNGVLFDDLDYDYYDFTNKLNHVTDAGNSSIHPNDIETQ